MSATFGATLAGHDVELDFDKKLIFINRARLRVDGAEVEQVSVLYGEKDLTTTLDDGTHIEVRLHSGMVGELTRAQIRGDDGSWTDLTQR